MTQEYMIATEGQDINNLVKRINELLSQGWKCQGGIAIGERGIVQALVKDIPTKKIKPNS